MKKKGLFIALGIAMALIAALVMQQSTLAQRSGGGVPGGMPGGAPGGAAMMQMVSVEGTWAFISFELDGVTNDMLVKCREALKESYKKSNELRTKAREARGDADAMRNLRTESDKIKSDMDAKLKAILTADQMTKIANWEKENRDRMRRSAPGGGAPGGAPGGGMPQR